ncbi:MAG: 16S rRNA (adenine(1518)-N(6)/adenine(1519)-N(6))-dimethyltransferase RsmA [bacterium]|nr:16S rRNA (adenine(1518)-N(6)/adenine(1519)-N(6))-dimethyltransferase RsmA [bacterium]
MVYAKKSLGQNFLNSKTVARDIVRAGELLPTDTVLEIGPGKGFLTVELLATGARVVAVEKDDRMIPILQEKFANEIKKGQLSLINADIMDVFQNKGPSFIFGAKKEKIKDGPLFEYKLVANIPYYLTGQIIRTFLEAGKKPERMILMLQKEVATRIVARDKKESILSIAVKAYGTPKLIKKVPARYFTPSPKVDSAILAILNISGKHFLDKKSEEHFFEIVRAGFAHKRKFLAGNLKEFFKEKTADILKGANISETARAENLTLENWLAIAKRSPRAHQCLKTRMSPRS